jgi:hypothetical protein
VEISLVDQSPRPLTIGVVSAKKSENAGFGFYVLTSRRIELVGKNGHCRRTCDSINAS